METFISKVKNQINQIIDKNLIENNIFDILDICNHFLNNENQEYKGINYPNNNDELFFLKKDINKNNNFLNLKRKASKEKINYGSNQIIKLKSNEKKYIKKANNKKKNVTINNKLIEIIKSDIFDYDINFESNIKTYNKNLFWKHFIFRKYGGDIKLSSEIVKDIQKYERNKNKKLNLLNIKTSKLNKEKENELTSENSNMNNKSNYNNIISIRIDDEDNFSINNDINDNNSREEENLLIEIENTKGLENESKFLKEFLYNDDFFINNTFFPDNFTNDENITKEILKENNILRKIISLKLYGVLKLIFPSLDENIIQKNIKYLELLANNIDKILGNKYLLIIEMIYSKLKKEAIKVKQNIKNKINLII